MSNIFIWVRTQLFFPYIYCVYTYLYINVINMQTVILFSIQPVCIQNLAKTTYSFAVKAPPFYLVEIKFVVSFVTSSVYVQ